MYFTVLIPYNCKTSLNVKQILLMWVAKCGNVLHSYYSFNIDDSYKNEKSVNYDIIQDFGCLEALMKMFVF